MPRKPVGQSQTVYLSAGAAKGMPIREHRRNRIFIVFGGKGVKGHHKGNTWEAAIRLTVNKGDWEGRAWKWTNGSTEQDGRKEQGNWDLRAPEDIWRTQLAAPLSCWRRGSKQPSVGHETQCDCTSHQGGKGKIRVSVQESNTSEKMWKQLDGNLNYWQAENQGDGPQAEAGSREERQRRDRQWKHKGKECST